MWNKVIDAYEKNEQPLETSQHVDVVVTSDDKKMKVKTSEIHPLFYPHSKSTFSMYLDKSL